MSDALLILNAPLPDKKMLRAVAKTVDLVACADGGLRTAVDCGIVPRIVIGDMDSRPKRLPKLPDTVYLCDFDEDRSDFEKSLAWLEEAGFNRVFVSGVRGGRVDHERVNWGIVRAWSRRLELAVVDGGITRLLGPGAYRFPAAPGRPVSLISDSASATLSSKGLRYALKKERILPGSRGLSNICLGKSFTVTVHAGRVWASMADA
ncbi:MAG: thiamine diphosphokinase [Elusimicrobia bacterium CG1_02_63_36]|nr:MAG: thiamine diphosphokinase [Elusimicrobia bacterium CG1_02_63_36]